MSDYLLWFGIMVLVNMAAMIALNVGVAIFCWPRCRWLVLINVCAIVVISLMMADVARDMCHRF